MSVYLVTWDLNKQKPNYNQARQNLIDHLARYEHIKDSGLDSVWFISSTLSADALDADIRTRMDTNDRVIVTKLVHGQHQGWLGQNLWDWINARL
ncbi:hypothetical protein NKI72_30190 [Mesorhizobium sp. M0437]|uniref:hypothetical protein n=1 Tax=Mesorhizobium sp. M0437 TaxID=2956945 RepID=UPI00333CD697